MELREPSPIPALFDFIRFLATSITFMTNLCQVSVYFDDNQLAQMTKENGIPLKVAIPKGLNAASPSNLMKVKEINTTCTSGHLKLSWFEVWNYVYIQRCKSRLKLQIGFIYHAPGNLCQRT